MKRRKGSTIMLAMVMAFMSVGLTSLIVASNNINDQAAVDADKFAQEQTLNSLGDLTVLQFSRDIQSITVNHSMASEWVGAKGSAIYSQVLAAFQSRVTVSDNATWTCQRLSDLTSALGISDPQAIACMQEAVGKGDSDINLKLSEQFSLNWENKACRVTAKGAYIPLNDIHLSLTVTHGYKSTCNKLVLKGLALQSDVYKDAGLAVYSIGGKPWIEREG